MSSSHGSARGRRTGRETSLVTGGRDPQAFHGFVNVPVYHGSTVLFPDTASLRSRSRPYLYGRRGTPTSRALEEALTALEGGHGTRLTPSGLAAIAAALLAFTRSGHHILVSDNVYRPTRLFCDRVLARYGIETVYYDPLIGAGIAEFMRENTRLVYIEAPGSQTFEMPDIPALVAAARAHGALVAMDNTWATPYFFRPLEHGVDISIQAATKYIVGHSDAMLGYVTVTEALRAELNDWYELCGLCVGPDDIFLASRGLRTLAVRLRAHMANGLALAEWLAQRPEVAQVLHPGLPGAPGHDIWKRDFGGASGLFSVLLEPVPETAVDAMLDGLELFGLGYSWGGYESLIIPFDPRSYRSATTWTHEGPALRIHAGLEKVDDLKRDLESGFARLAAAAG